MRDKLLNRAPQDFNLRIAATSKKQTVRVPLPTPHPLNPKNASEPGRLIKEEIVAMQKVATAAYKRELDSLKGYSVKRIQP
jgi:hypothetical protein